MRESDKLEKYVSQLAELKSEIVIRRFSVIASEQELKRRIDARPADEFKEYEVSRKLNRDTIRRKTNDEFQIDSSQLTPSQTAEAIHKHLAAG